MVRLGKSSPPRKPAGRDVIIVLWMLMHPWPTDCKGRTGCQSLLKAPYLKHNENNPAFLESSLLVDLAEPVDDVEALSTKRWDSAC